MNREVWGGVYLKIGRVGAVVLHFVHGRMTVDVQPQLDDSILTSCSGSESKPEAKDCFVDSRYCYDLHPKVHVAVKCGSWAFPFFSHQMSSRAGSIAEDHRWYGCQPAICFLHFTSVQRCRISEESKSRCSRSSIPTAHICKVAWCSFDVGFFERLEALQTHLVAVLGTTRQQRFSLFPEALRIYKVSNKQRQNHPTYCSPGSWFWGQVVLHPFTFDCADVPTGVTSVTMARCMRNLAWHLAMKCHFWWWEVIFSLKLAWHQEIDCMWYYFVHGIAKGICSRVWTATTCG